jgi:hypothetical protein
MLECFTLRLITNTMKALVAESEQRGALLIGMENVVSIVNRCKIYESLALLNIKRRETGQAMENFESAIQSLYAAVLRFLSCAASLYTKNTGSRAISAFLQPERVNILVNEFQELEQGVDVEVENWERTQGRTWQGMIESRVLRIDDKVASLWQRSTEIDHCTLLTWVSAIAYEEVHNSTK